MNNLRYRLGFIGGGKLAGSVIRGLLRAKFCRPNELIVAEPNESLRESLGKDLGIAVTAKNAELAETAKVIFLGIKPGVVLPVLETLGASLGGKLVISLAAGVATAPMDEKSSARFMRAMTNTPAAVCQAATALARGARTTEDDLQKARDIFSAVGTVVEVLEAQIDAVTALSGSGPAFVYTMIEALAAGGEQCGLPNETSLALSIQTFRGAAQLALESGLSPEELRKMVITPGGTTAAGLAVMEKHASADGISRAVVAAEARAKELLAGLSDPAPNEK